jgi:tetrahydromethanopterin S-methyltransferase subunit G
MPTANQVAADASLARIEARLESIENRLGFMEREMAETRGAYRLAKFVIALLGISGLSGVAAFLANNK